MHKSLTLFAILTLLFFNSTSKAEEFINGIGMQFVLINSGTFVMGGDPVLGSETPRHLVTISQPFFLGKYEVTQSQFELIMGYNKSTIKGSFLPVTNVSWEEAHLFVVLLNMRLKTKAYRLPTEAEWEYAARAGVSSVGYYRYPEAYILPLDWIDSNANLSLHGIGQKKANYYGLYDMNGNVAEWVHDRFAANYYLKSPRTDPKGPFFGMKRVYRGGSYLLSADYARPTRRYAEYGISRFTGIGFRVALNANHEAVDFPSGPKPILPYCKGEDQAQYSSSSSSSPYGSQNFDPQEASFPVCQPKPDEEEPPAETLAAVGLPFEFEDGDEYCTAKNPKTKEVERVPCTDDGTTKTHYYWYNYPGSGCHKYMTEFNACQGKAPYNKTSKNDQFAIDVNYSNGAIEATRNVIAIEDGEVVCTNSTYGYVLLRHSKKLQTGITYGPNSANLDDNFVRTYSEKDPTTQQSTTKTEYVWYSGYMHMNLNAKCPNISENNTLNNIDPNKPQTNPTLVSLRAGCMVRRGDALGLISDVGIRGAVHLHFAVYDKDKYSFSPYFLKNAEDSNIPLSYEDFSYGGYLGTGKPDNTQSKRFKDTGKEYQNKNSGYGSTDC
ncbi:MAG: formylglycine-generating enzyme family protein [Deltaproteobacteria bacterium]|jgi:formylglycine-generating enzyme required for sulfatase activity|nr:formylglycine-generating enzyme family protein [Deltaproteobacteria bacterium]